MQVVFCRPESTQSQRDGFEDEADVLERFGLEPACISMEAVVSGDLDGAVASIPRGWGDTLLRSWMLTEEAYADLHDALAERGVVLVNDPASYAAAHYLPAYLDAIASVTPPTRCMDGIDLAEAWSLARELGPGPYILKDHVKSAKEDPTCGIVPANSSRADFERIVRGFIAHRGDAFERGLVLRAMLPLAPLGSDAEGRPCFDEVRLVFWRGTLIAAAPYNDLECERRDFSAFSWLGARIPSEFFTADVARLVTGAWIVLEVGAGEVSTLPPLMDPAAVYASILENEEGGWS